MALISAQRVEFLTGELLKHLEEFDKEIYGVTSVEFLSQSAKSKNAIKTLGAIFKLLKLNPEWIIETELNEYLKARNILVHSFWENFLHTMSEEQANKAVYFCNNFGSMSVKVESYFRGFLYLLALRHVEDESHLDDNMKRNKSDFENFIQTLEHNHLKPSWIIEE